MIEYTPVRIRYLNRYKILSLSILILFNTTVVSFAKDKYNGWSFISADELYQMCTSKNSEDHRACTAYICGVIDAWSAEYILGAKVAYSICLPTGITCEDLSVVVLNDLSANPEHKKSIASGIVGFFIEAKIPLQIAMEQL